MRNSVARRSGLHGTWEWLLPSCAERGPCHAHYKSGNAERRDVVDSFFPDRGNVFRRMPELNAMNREMEIAHLAIAEKAVLQGEEHILQQEVRVAELDRDGHDTKQAL